MNPEFFRALEARRTRAIVERDLEAIEALLVIDDVVALPVELRDDLRAGRAFDVVLAHRALAAGREAVGLGLHGVHRLPEVRHHAFAAEIFYFSVDQNHVDDG